MTIWQPYSETWYDSTPKPVADWLSKPQRLTQHLKKVYPDCFLTRLGEAKLPVTDDEAEPLSMLPHTLIWFRHIIEKSAIQALVYSRVVVPLSTFEAFKEAFTNLQQRPIGDTLLFDNPEVSRRLLHFRLILPQEVAYQAAFEALETDQPCYARRSVFHWRGYPLLITEIFANTLQPFMPL